MRPTASKKFRRACRVAIVAMVMHVAAVMTLGVTLEAYEARIESVRQSAVRLEGDLREDEYATQGAQEFADRIRKEFPPTERIEWFGGVVEANHGWLLGKASALHGESNASMRLLFTIEIGEYLSAIAFKLDELEQGGQQAKDQDKQKLAEILRREEYQKPQPKQESVFQRWVSEFLEWLEGLFPKPSGPSQQSSGLGVLSVVLQIILYVGLLLLLAFILYKVVPLIFPQIRRARRPKEKKERVILGEHLAEDATAVDLLTEADRLAREGNLRGAIRKGYIALLCDLSDRKVIGLARNKTNRDYLRDVRSRRELHPRMKSVTDTFERHWYGFQESGEQDWVRFREEYQEAIRNVS